MFTIHQPRARRIRSTRLVRPAGVALAGLLVAGTAACSSGLSGDSEDDSIDAWPTDLEAAGQSTTPVYSDVTLIGREVLRLDDGTAWAFFDIENEGNEDLTVGDVLGDRDVMNFTLYDPDGNEEYWPAQIDDDVETGGCVCSTPGLAVPAGETTSLHVAFTGVPDAVDSVRLNIGQFQPIADVPVRDVGRLAVSDEASSDVEYDEDLEIRVVSVRRHPDGTLVSLRYVNKGSNEPVSVTEFPEPGSLRLLSPDLETAYLAREADLEPVATELSGDETTLERGESADVEVLVAEVPEDTDAVLVRGPGLRGSLPAPISDDEPEPTLDIPENFDEPVIRTLRSPTRRYHEPMVDTARPDLPSVEELGPELPEVPVSHSITSAVQPGWSIDVRGVVRGPGDLSTLLLDMNRNGADDSWPEGLGADDSTQYQGLGGLSVIDPVAQARYGMVDNEEGALVGGDSWLPDDGETMPVYAVFGPLDPSTTRVSVDIPTFGRVDDVPVVDGDGDDDSRGGSRGDEVKSTMRVRGNPALRMDVLTVTRLDGGNGTLVRARLVNESAPEAVSAPFATEGSGEPNLCDMELTDPATGDYVWALPPCEATWWSADLGEGEQLVYEVRFPELADEVEQVVFSGGGYFPSTPMPVEDDQLPWYLPFPHVYEDPEGGTLVIPEGSPDRGETTTRTGDEVEISLATDVLFEFDSAALTPDAAARVAELAGQIGEQAAGGTVTITGYTDDVGDDAYNEGLSQQRAESVRAALEPAMRRSDLTFEVSGRGEADPVAPNQINGVDNPDGRARNRRVTITYDAE